MATQLAAQMAAQMAALLAAGCRRMADCAHETHETQEPENLHLALRPLISGVNSNARLKAQWKGDGAHWDILPFRSRSPDAVYVQRCRSYNSRCASNICYLIPSYVSNSIDKIMHHEYRHEFSCANSHVSTLKVHQLVSAVALIPSSNRSQSLLRTLLSR